MGSPDSSPVQNKRVGFCMFILYIPAAGEASIPIDQRRAASGCPFCGLVGGVPCEASPQAWQVPHLLEGSGGLEGASLMLLEFTKGLSELIPQRGALGGLMKLIILNNVWTEDQTCKSRCICFQEAWTPRPSGQN